MNVTDKILRSWWVLLSFIPMLNGFGFLFIGFRHDNKNWFLEGIMYEVPWAFSVIFTYYEHIANPLYGVVFILMLISILRSFWVVVKLGDVYDNVEKYSVRPTAIKNHDAPQKNNLSVYWACCVCLIAIFILFVLFGIFN